MTRTDVMASSRPKTEGAAGVSRGSSGGWRRLILLPVLLLLAIAVAAPTSAVAETTTNKEGLSGYTKTEEKSGTSPEKEKATPEAKEAPKSETAPSSSAPEAEKASTLPFTGFDLRWTLGMGLLLVTAGFSIVTVQRRHRRSGGR
jgi:hypothetical protein